MSQDRDKDYWESHWERADAAEAGLEIVPNPHLADEIGGMAPGTALDAGCGEGAEAIWLAAHGWNVIAVDISTAVLSRAAERAGVASESVQWVEADLSVWIPGLQFDLVTTHYAHPAIPQLAFYERISDWVAPSGTLLIVGHLHTPETEHGHGMERHGHENLPPEEASVTVANVTAVFDDTEWDIVTAEERSRTLTTRAGQSVPVRDVVVRATRRGGDIDAAELATGEATLGSA